MLRKILFSIIILTWSIMFYIAFFHIDSSSFYAWRLFLGYAAIPVALTIFIIVYRITFIEKKKHRSSAKRTVQSNKR